MKGKLFKKIVAIISALSIAAAMMVAPASAAVGDVVEVVNDTFKSGVPANPDGGEYTWGTELTDIFTTSGLLLTNKNSTANNYSDKSLIEFAEPVGDASHKVNIDYSVAHQSKSKGQAYSNFIVSYYNADNEFMFSIAECVGNWADNSVITYANEAGSTETVTVGTHIGKTVSAEVSFDGESGYLIIDGATYKFPTDSGIKYVNVSVSGGQDWERGIYISNYKMTTTEVEVIQYATVTYSVNGVESTDTVVSGECVDETKIPDTTYPGYIFSGWSIDGDETNLVSTEDLKAMPINADMTLTAVYAVDESYIEPIVSAEIEGSSLMTIGADADTAAANEYTVKLVGEKGTVITLDTLSSKVTDFSVAWDIEGFKTENDVTDNSYCDYYGGFESKVTNDVRAVFNLRKNASMNFFGVLKATVTYNGETVTASMPVVAISNTDVPSNQILPEPGYPSDMDAYPDALIGYKSVAETTSGNDVIFGGWNMSGSDGKKSATLSSDETGKFVRVYGETAKKSKVFSNAITAPQTQVIFEQELRFNNASASVTLTEGSPFWLEKNYSSAVTVNFDGTNIKLNGTVATMNDETVTIETGKWYKIVLSVDKTNETAFVYVYDNGELIAKTDNVAWESSCSPTYYGIALGNSNTASSIDLGSYKVYYPTADESTFEIVATQTTLSIPNGDTAGLTASLKTADGYDVTGAATWTVLEDDMNEGVIVTPDATDSHKAKVTLSDAAVAGEATVQVNIGGYVKSVKLNITSSAESVKFSESSSSLSIPIEDDQTTVAKYVADVINGQGEELGRDITLAIYDKTNTTEYTLPEGITFDTATGTLTITSAAKACTFTVRATGKNTDGEEITRSVKVTVHGLAFDFGAGTDEDVAEGYTSVTAGTAYTEAAGYGITGTVTAGGTGAVDNADSDYLEGTMTFKANVPSAKLYKVEITYQGTLTAEPVNSDLAAYTLGTQDALAKAEYTVPVIDDVLELTVSSTDTVTAQVASIVVTKLEDKTATAKPSLYIIGDSTLSNNGSWGYYLSHNTDKFPELYNIVDVHICGRGGSNLSKYYTSGDFLNKILLNVKPGDIVSLGNMGTNGGAGALFETNFNYYLDAVEALGAKIMIHSYSPHGATPSDADKENGLYYNSNLSWYDPTTQIFNGKRTDAYDNIARKVAEERAASDENYLGFVDIGERSDAAFNAYVDDYAANGYASREEAAKAIIAAFPDHNHYSGIASQLIVAGYGDVEGTAAGYVDVLTPYVESITPEPTPTGLVVDKCDFNTENGAVADVKVTNYTDDKANVGAVIAAYDKDGALVKVVVESDDDIEIGASATFNPALSVDNAVNYKLFVWDMNNYNPLVK